MGYIGETADWFTKTRTLRQTRGVYIIGHIFSSFVRYQRIDSRKFNKTVSTADNFTSSHRPAIRNKFHQVNNLRLYSLKKIHENKNSFDLKGEQLVLYSRLKTIDLNK